MLFPELSSSSKVWVYTSNRVLGDEEVTTLQNKVNFFVKDWAAHGTGLNAKGEVFENRFLVLVADETNVSASGCSIDSSVKFVKSVGQELSVDFFNRMQLVIRKGDQLKYVHVSDLKDYMEWEVYNPMITTLDELRSSWRVRISASPFAAL